ncbi:MAG: T9SS type A sorting domain-containing protein [Bacteroidales bacterium]|nr:T9SS type A sorting domain-containing protein [Bacteroidales bacterium]
MKKLLFIIIILINTINYSNAQNPDAIIHFLITNFEDNNPYPYCPAWLTDTINPWIIDTTNHENIWQIGKQQKVFFDSAYSVPNAIVTDTINPYPINNHSSFQFNIIKPDWAWWMCWSSISLFFHHKYDTDSLYDGGYIDISYDGGTTWTNVIFDENNNCDFIPYGVFYSENDTILGGIPAFTGNSNDWTETQLIWYWPKEYGMLTDSAIIRFNFVSDSIYTSKEGWMIDEIYFLLEDYCNIGIEENSIQINFVKISPNPVTDISIMEFKNEQFENFTLAIYNITGTKIKVIQNIKENKVELNRNEFKKGIYLYRLYNTRLNIYTGKFIVE